MPEQTCDWYRITCLTNLHAGRGDTNYDIVDKEVQRDPIEELPIIHASSLKGSLREWFRQLLPGPKATEKQRDHSTVDGIFGNDSKRYEGQDLKTGSHQFFEGRLLALPVRSSHRPYFLATSKDLLLDCLDQLTLFDITYAEADRLRDVLSQLEGPVVGHPWALWTPTPEEQQAIADNALFLDEYSAELSGPIELLETLLDYKHIALFHHDDLKAVAGRLPVIARNNLENGRSVNLWYEEVVPRQTRFSFFVRHSSNDKAFANTLEKGKWRVQIGANATIGYGQCLLTNMTLNTSFENEPVAADS